MSLNKIELDFAGLDDVWKNDTDQPVMVTDVFVGDGPSDPTNLTVHVYKILEPGDTLRLKELL